MTADLCRTANYVTRPDVRALLAAALGADNSPAGRAALGQLLANSDVAAAEVLPLCQDCGYVTVFAGVGQDVRFNGPFEAAVHDGVTRAYTQGYLRQSVIRDALTDRISPEREHPANIHLSLVAGDKLRLTVLAKGGGSDNASSMAMLRPTAGEDEIVKLVVETVARSGRSACPPLFIGVGIGGSFDSVGFLAKKALLRDFREPAADPIVAALEARLLTEINALGIGPAALGGQTTALGVALLTDRTHIACMPVAVNICCNQLRSATGEI